MDVPFLIVGVGFLRIALMMEEERESDDDDVGGGDGQEEEGEMDVCARLENNLELMRGESEVVDPEWGLNSRVFCDSLFFSG
jgi:hypothetical protein